MIYGIPPEVYNMQIEVLKQELEFYKNMLTQRVQEIDRLNRLLWEHGTERILTEQEVEYTEGMMRLIQEIIETKGSNHLLLDPNPTIRMITKLALDKSKYCKS